MQKFTQVPALVAIHDLLKNGHKLYGDTPPWGSHAVQLEKSGVKGYCEDLHWVDAMIGLDIELGGATLVSASDGRTGLLNAIEIIDDTFNRTRSPLRAWYENGKIVFERLAWERTSSSFDRFKWVGTGDDIWEALQNALQATPEPISSRY